MLPPANLSLKYGQTGIVKSLKAKTAVCIKPWFSLAHKPKHKHKHMCIASENWVDISMSISISTRKTDRFVLLVLVLTLMS